MQNLNEPDVDPASEPKPIGTVLDDLFAGWGK